MDHAPSLHSIMNAMAARLDDVLPEPLQNLPADKDWPFIHLYLGSDQVLAQLYKQYCDTRTRLDQLHKEFGHNDGMVAIARDLKDSAHTAIETRMIELKENKAVTGQAAARLQAQQHVQKHSRKIEKSEEAFDRVIAMMIWAKIVIKTGRMPLPAVKRQFSLAA